MFDCLQDIVAFNWKYSFYDSEYVADERWQKLKATIDEWLPMIIRDPLPFATALCARIAEAGVYNVFVTLAFVVALLFEELANRADRMSFDKDNSDEIRKQLE